MKLPTEITLKLLQINFGILVGILTYFLPLSSNSGNLRLSILIAIASVILISTLFSSKQGPNLEEEKFQQILNQEISKLSKAVYDSSKDLLYVYQLLQYSQITIPQEKIPRVWLEMLWMTKKRYWATTYISPNQGWNEAFTDLGEEIQRAKIVAEQVDICRIFIVEDENELRHLNVILNSQANIGIRIKYILIADIRKTASLANHQKQLATIDFGIIDDKYVYETHLVKRMAMHSSITFNPDQLRHYIDFFRLLRSEAKEFNYK
ncbi:MAG: hypothetical protein AB8H47_27880 [Bacteroidia bacterium]